MPNKMLSITAACFVLLFQVGQIRAEESTHAEPPKGIVELFALAKGKDPVVGKADARLEAGKADRDIAWSGVLPRISANATQRRFWHTVLNYGPKTIEGAYTGHSYGVGGQLPVFNAPSYFQIAAANAGLRSAEAGTDAAQQDLIVRLVSAYVGILKAQGDEQLYRDELRRFTKIQEQAEAALKVGAGDVIAVYEAKARLDSAAAELLKAEAQRRLAEQNLSGLTGITVTVVKNLPITTPAGPQPDDIKWWIDTMQKQNPGIRQAREELRAAEHVSRANWSGHLPTVQLQGGYTVDKGSTFLPEVETKQWYVGANISLPIFSGGETTARTRRAVAAEREQRVTLDDIHEQNVKRLKEIFLNLRYSVSLVEAYRRKYESGELQLKATRKGHEIGTRSAIDLLNSEQAFATARRDLSNALYDNLVRGFELKAAAGILKEEDLASLAGSPTQL